MRGTGTTRLEGRRRQDRVLRPRGTLVSESEKFYLPNPVKRQRGTIGTTEKNRHLLTEPKLSAIYLVLPENKIVDMKSLRKYTCRVRAHFTGHCHCATPKTVETKYSRNP